MPKLKIISLNVNSLISLNRRHLLDDILRTHKPDIMMLNETKVKAKHRLSFRKYTCIRTDRMHNKGGGCAILIKEKCNFNKIEIKNLTVIEHCAIKIYNEITKTHINIIAIYNSTGENDITNDLNQICQQTTDGDLIIGGDFNAKDPAWGNCSVNKAGKKLKEWLYNEGFTQNMVLQPTNEPTRENSYIDFFLTSNWLSIKYNNRHPLYLKIIPSFSDHAAVELEINNQKIPDKEKQMILDYKNSDINKYQRYITNALNLIDLDADRNLTNDEIKLAVEKLNDIIKSAIETAVPKVELKESGLLKLNNLTEKLISTKKRLRRRLHRTGNTTLKAHIKNVDILIKEQINIAYNSYWQNKFQNIKMNKDTFKQLKNVARAHIKQTMPTLTHNNEICEDNEAKANSLAKFWSNIYQQNSTTSDTETITAVNTTTNQIINSQPLFQFNEEMKASKDINMQTVNNIYDQFLNIEQLDEIIKSRNNKFSAGNDCIPMFLLKKTPISMKKYLVILFNNMYNNAYIPLKWKEALLIPILKQNKDPQSPASYRMISLLSNMSKLYEMFIHQKIIKFINEKRIYKDFQFGFRHQHSTTHALAIFMADVSKQLNKRYGTIAVSLDLEKAFDTAWQSGIIYKMKEIYDFPDHYCKIIVNYLDNRTFKVKVEDKTSNSNIIHNGVPQGSILGPTLYNLYTMDIPEPENDKVKKLIFADDILAYASCPILSKAQKQINDYLKEILQYTKKWNLKLNIAKCETIKIATKKCYRNAKKLKLCIKIGDDIIKNVKNMKYLGLVINESFKLNKHVDKIINKCKAVLILYSRVLRAKCSLSSRIKLIFYKQILRPVLAYGFPAWYNLTPRMMEKIRTFERRFLRHITGLNRRNNFKYHKNKDLYNKAKINRIDNFLLKQALKFAAKLDCSENSKIQNLTHQEVSLDDEHYNINHLKLLKRENRLYNDKNIIYFNGAYDNAQYAE